MIRLFIFILLLPLFVIGQDSSKTDNLNFRFVLGFGPGAGIPVHIEQPDAQGLSCAFQVSVQMKKAILTAAVRRVEKLAFLGDIKSGAVESFEITYGRALSSKAFFINVNGGIGLVNQITKGRNISTTSWNKYERIKNYTVGLPISVKAFWVPAGYFAFGPEFFINVNKLNTFYGMNISIQFQIIPKNKKSK